MNDLAIKVNHISKAFKLPHEKNSSIKSSVINFYRRRKGYELQKALSDVSFEIKRGEFFGIVGRNGSGKSTLLKLLAGVYVPNSGDIVVNGSLTPFIELGVGFNPELTGRENVFLNGALLGFSRPEMSSMYQDIVAFAELEKFMDQKLKNYSSGMQVRLAFSIAIRAKSDILLLDEVLAVGDADFQRKCYDYFNHLKKAKTTVVFVSHDMSAVRQYCDRAMLIENSRIVKIGNTEAVTEAYVKLFMQDQPVDKDIKAAGNRANRWGDGAAVTKALNVKVTEQTIAIEQQIEIKGEIEQPIIGFRLRNKDGQEITGTNSLIEGLDTTGLKKGDQLTINWSFENVLPEDKYSLDPAILHNDGVTVAEWWNGAQEFQVKRRRRLPYVIQPSFKFEVKK